MPDTPQKLIETVREALEAMKAEWSILPKSATFRIEDITEWLIRFVDPHMKRIEDSLESLSKLEAALDEKTVPMAMLQRIGQLAVDTWCSGCIEYPNEKYANIAKQYMPDFTVK